MSDQELLKEIKDACCNGHMDYANECLEKIQIFSIFYEARDIIEAFEDSPDHGS